MYTYFEHVQKPIYFAAVMISHGNILFTITSNAIASEEEAKVVQVSAVWAQKERHC